MSRAMADLAAELMLNPRLQVCHMIDSGRLRGGQRTYMGVVAPPRE